jgi:hypothetical protein
MKWISGLLDRIFSVAGALLFIQAPEYLQQYLQRLGGHVDELGIQIAKLTQIAGSTGKTLEAYIQKFVTSGDLDYAYQGQLLQNLIDKHEKLAKSLYEIQHASSLERGVKFLFYIDPEIARATLNNFVPGVTLSLEGLIYGLVGLIFGWMVYSAIKRLISIPYHWVVKEDPNSRL